MPYYLKISYQGKMKKFSVPNPKVLSLQQIKSSFVPPIPMPMKLHYEITEPDSAVTIVKSDQELLDFLKNRQF